MSQSDAMRRKLVIFLATFLLSLLLLVSVVMVMSFSHIDTEERVLELQRALAGVDLLAKHGFRDAERGKEVSAALRACVASMSPGHPDAEAFRKLAELVPMCTGFGADTRHSLLVATSEAAGAVAAGPVHAQIKLRAEAIRAWIDGEARAVEEVEKAEAAVAAGNFEAAEEVFARVPAASLYAGRALAVRDAIRSAQAALEEKRRREEEREAELVRASFEEFLGRMEREIADGRLAEVREQIARVEPTAPEWVQDRLRPLTLRLKIAEVRAEAEKAYLAGRGVAVIALLQTRTEPELKELCDKVSRVVVRYEEFVRAEDEGRVDDAERLGLELSVLEPSPRVWYREQVLRALDADPAARAARWLERAVKCQGQGDLMTARRLMEAARQVNPGPAAESAIGGLISAIQRDFNMITAQVRQGGITREEAIDRLDRLRAGLLPSDKFTDKLEDFRRQVAR